MGKRLNMLTPERVSMLLLALALIVWAIVALIDNHSGRGKTTPAVIINDEIVRQDTSILIENHDTVKSKAAKESTDKKIKKRSSKQKRDNKKPVNVPQRDHLNEPVD